MADIEAISKPNNEPPMTATAVMIYMFPTVISLDLIPSLIV
jgi:hypothetical protein